MPLKTLGTTANNSLNGYVVGADDVVAAQDALLNGLIRNDDINGRPKVGAAYIKKGVLWVPNRGYLTLQDGDYIGVDTATGWPIVVSAAAIASGPWAHS